MVTLYSTPVSARPLRLPHALAGLSGDVAFRTVVSMTVAKSQCLYSTRHRSAVCGSATRHWSPLATSSSTSRSIRWRCTAWSPAAAPTSPARSRSVGHRRTDLSVAVTGHSQMLTKAFRAGENMVREGSSGEGWKTLEGRDGGTLANGLLDSSSGSADCCGASRQRLQ